MRRAAIGRTGGRGALASLTACASETPRAALAAIVPAAALAFCAAWLLIHSLATRSRMLASGAGAAGNDLGRRYHRITLVVRQSDDLGRIVGGDLEPGLHRRRELRGRLVSGVGARCSGRGDQWRVRDRHFGGCRRLDEIAAFVDRILDLVDHILDRLLALVGGELRGDFAARLVERFAADRLHRIRPWRRPSRSRTGSARPPRLETRQTRPRPPCRRQRPHRPRGSGP